MQPGYGCFTTILGNSEEYAELMPHPTPHPKLVFPHVAFEFFRWGGRMCHAVVETWCAHTSSGILAFRVNGV